jgi:hypothetical protein
MTAPIGHFPAGVRAVRQPGWRGAPKWAITYLWPSGAPAA